MKKITLFIVLCFSIAWSHAQYPFTLPLTFSNFFASSAMGESPKLEFGQYAAATDAINQNKWNLTRATSAQTGESPVVEDNALSYSNYIDNNKGKAIVLNKTNTSRASVFSLVNDFEFRSRFVYVGVLVNFSSAPANETSFLHWDGDYTANNARGVAFVKADGEDGFKIGFGASTAATIKGRTEKLNFNQTYFLVLKAYAAGTVASGDTGIDIYTMYFNPVIGNTEAQSAGNLIAEITNNGVAGHIIETAVSRMSNGVRGIVVRQNTDIGAKIAGLRFSDNWEDVVKGAPNSVSNYTKSSFSVAVNADKQIELVAPSNSKYSVYNAMGQLLNSGTISSERQTIRTQLKAGVYVVKVGDESSKVIIQ